MVDVVIAGAGPAGSIAALVLARAGVRVVLLDRDEFPRDKLCGDTLNPGAIGLLTSLGLAGGPIANAPRLAGMIVSGPRARVEARYGGGVAGRAIRRTVLDAWLLDQALAAGARLESGIVVREPLVEETGGTPIVRGVAFSRRGAADRLTRLPAAMTIAADGRRSVLGRALGLAWQPSTPRRWAAGTYATGIAGTSDLGEMHISGRSYVGIAPMGDAACNVCAVTGAWAPGRRPIDVMRQMIQADARLRDRFGAAQFESPVRVLGPLAVESSASGVVGLLLAGDAAGFIDPMTGDGLHLAMKGALLAADAALWALQTGDRPGAVTRLAAARRDQLAPKLRFNRALRRLVDAPWAVQAAGWGAEVAPGLVRWAVRHAGDAA